MFDWIQIVHGVAHYHAGNLAAFFFSSHTRQVRSMGSCCWHQILTHPQHQQKSRVVRPVFNCPFMLSLFPVQHYISEWNPMYFSTLVVADPPRSWMCYTFCDASLLTWVAKSGYFSQHCCSVSSVQPGHSPLTPLRCFFLHNSPYVLFVCHTILKETVQQSHQVTICEHQVDVNINRSSGAVSAWF